MNTNTLLCIEKEILDYWNKEDSFNTLQQSSKDAQKPPFVFYDGPPFATGTPHYGHILAGTMKDVIGRFQTMNGKYVPRQFGWDCHGLPVETIVNQSITPGSSLKEYNQACRSVVMKCEKDWEKTVERMGRWVDFKDSYKTMDIHFMDQVWGIFKELYDKGFIYQGRKVMPVSTSLGTSLSNFEANLNYKTVQHTDAFVLFPLCSDEDTAFIAWTTTPWTLPAHVALCVHPEMEYIIYEYETNTPVKKYIVGKSFKVPTSWKEVKRVLGIELVGLEIDPPFSSLSSTPPRVIADTFVKDDMGTGVLHLAPCFGEEDYRICKENGFNEMDFPCPVTINGYYTTEVVSFEGRHIHESTLCKDILSYLKEKTPNRLWKQSVIHHSYPHCWRTDTPLMYRAVNSWFLDVESIKEELKQNNQNVTWIPSSIGEHRFHNWLDQARDWALSRTRNWGTPIPIWISDDGEEIRVISSRKELESLSSSSIFDLHRESVDFLEIPSTQGKGMLKRIPDVFDCWFESGSVPIIKSKELGNNFVPADFVAEGLDQTRGWFYTTLVLSTALFKTAPYKHVMCSGLVLAEDGKKMSKRLQNYTDPTVILDTYGADALRMYLLDSPVVKGESLRFRDEGVMEITKTILLPMLNAVRYFQEICQSTTGVTFKEKNTPSGELFDTWILNYMNHFAEKIYQDLQNYRLDTIVTYIRDCVDHITNVYIRMNRYRFRDSHLCFTALTQLKCVLDMFAKIIAPIAPFLSEWMFQTLHQKSNGSVHAQSFPNRGSIDFEIMKKMESFIEMVEELRRIRLELKRPIKSPLKKVTIVCETTDLIDLHLYSSLKKELNLWELTFENDLSRYVQIEWIPNLGAIGKTFGKQSKQILLDIREGMYSPLLEKGIHIVKKCKLISSENEKESIFLNKKETMVFVVDTLVSSEMQFEESVREWIQTIQSLRKDLGASSIHHCKLYACNVPDKIQLRLQQEIGFKNTFDFTNISDEIKKYKHKFYNEYTIYGYIMHKMDDACDEESV